MLAIRQSNCFNFKTNMNSNLVGILRERNATRRRRQLCSLFSELSSADSTLEAFSAALERERHLQDKQLRVLRELKTLIGRHDLTKVCTPTSFLNFSLPVTLCTGAYATDIA